ncbi:MAG: hypothetical protein AB1485_04010, partial [Candidatus Thermoplasmatota archaeon]
RIYPVPLSAYSVAKRNADKSWKKSWVEYEIREKTPEPHRKESIKIYPKTMRVIKRENEEEVRRILKKQVTTVESLLAGRKEGISLGVIKPILEKFEIKPRERAKVWERKFLGQQTLYGEEAVQIDLIDKWIGYQFKCNKESCSGHKCMCEDFEVGNLYRNVKAKYSDEHIVYEKMKYRLFDWMREARDLYFVMGTEIKYGQYLIISLVYPPKIFEKPLTEF